jgi:hypothetical protein
MKKIAEVLGKHMTRVGAARLATATTLPMAAANEK